ncbi:hypothetical protein N7G274_006919 [Stereocaulon virgatum]|uniref:Uncharacterized protein n=1 Tax=Stereocaulon virgatum TaxID=373712 RepID=A0ABR4A6E1_9LECA
MILDAYTRLSHVIRYTSKKVLYILYKSLKAWQSSVQAPSHTLKVTRMGYPLNCHASPQTGPTWSLDIPPESAKTAISLLRRTRSRPSSNAARAGGDAEGKSPSTVL